MDTPFLGELAVVLYLSRGRISIDPPILPVQMAAVFNVNPLGFNIQAMSGCPPPFTPLPAPGDDHRRYLLCRCWRCCRWHFKVCFIRCAVVCFIAVNSDPIRKGIMEDHGQLSSSFFDLQCCEPDLFAITECIWVPSCLLA